jgi:hypothetical protein
MDPGTGGKLIGKGVHFHRTFLHYHVIALERDFLLGSLL